ncbi:MAG: hypothetical protein RLN70_05380 [Rhodospirillaceae bacterium]
MFVTHCYSAISLWTQHDMTATSRGYSRSPWCVAETGAVPGIEEKEIVMGAFVISCIAATLMVTASSVINATRGFLSKAR